MSTEQVTDWINPDHELKSDEILIWVRTDVDSLNFDWVKTIYIEKFWAEIRDIITWWFNRDNLLNPCNSIERSTWELNDSFKKRVAEWLESEKKRESDAREANHDIFYNGR